MMDMQHCVGCEDDFYNDKNPMGVKRCWMLETAVLKTRYRISRDAPMGDRENYRKCERPSCYHGSGFVMLNEIPSYAK
jgi:hypothetical protein